MGVRSETGKTGMLRRKIKKLIQKATQASDNIKIEYPADPKFGDYATNIAFLLARRSLGEGGLAHKENKRPIEIAKHIAEKIQSYPEAKKIFNKVEAAGAGFINFMLSEEFLNKQLAEYVRCPTPHINIGKDAKLNIEFLSANPTGKFQVGNGRGGFYGDVLGNILRLAGYKVTKEYYINNAKSSNQIQELGKTALGKGEKYLTPYVLEKIKGLAPPLLTKERGLHCPSEALCEGGGGEVAKAGFFLAAEIHKDNKEFLEKKAKILFDVWTEEEDLYKKNLLKKTLEYLKKKNLVYEKEGAQWLKTIKFGDPAKRGKSHAERGDDKDKVIVRSSGEYGYYLSDIAYHQDKIKRGYKIIIDVLGADHQGHVAPMQIAMKILGYKGKFDVLVSQLVQAKGGGKFSKRQGNVISLEELINEVGIDAARFFYLMKSLDTQMEFDLDLAKEQSLKNPVYYVQYAHARMASILRNAQYNFQFSIFNFQSISKFSKLLKHQSELNLIKYMLRWPEVVEDTANDYQVQRVTGYATDLAIVFNQFYRDCKVISEDEILTKARLILVLAAKNVLKEVLDTLGISAPEKM